MQTINGFFQKKVSQKLLNFANFFKDASRKVELRKNSDNFKYCVLLEK